MSAIHTITKLLLNNTNRKKITKQRVDYLLSALALSALSQQALAGGSEEGYKIDVKKLAQDAGIEITDINKVELTLAEGSKGEVVSLGKGVFEFVPAEGSTNVTFVIGGSGIASSFTSDFSVAVGTSLQEGFAKSWNDFIDSLSSDSSISASKVEVDFDMSALGLGVLALAAGGSSSAANILQTLTGVASHGTLENARVFLDLDGDSVWDANDEISALTNSAGEYSLADISAADIAAGTLVVTSYDDGQGTKTVDTISGSNVENIVMKADTSATVITPLTTLVNAGVSNADVIDILGLDATTNLDINNFNPFSTDNDGTADAIAFEKVASQIFTTVNTIAEAIDSAAGSDIDATTVFTLAIAEVVEKIEEEVQLREANVVIEAEAVALQAEADALQAEADALQVIVDAGGDAATQAEIDLAAKKAEKTTKDSEVSAKNATKSIEADISLVDASLIEEIATNTIVEVDTQIKAVKAAEKVVLEAEADALQAEADALQVIVDAGGDAATQAEIDLAAKKAEKTTKDSEVSAKDPEAVTDKISDAVTALTADVSKAVANINTQINEIAVFDSTAKDTLNVGAEKLAAQVVAAVDLGDSISLAADTLITTNEDASVSARTFEVTGTSNASSVDAAGVYGDLSHDRGSNWVYTPHTSNNHGQALNDMEVYDETFVITDADSTTHSITVVVVGRNDAPVITSSATGVITEDASTENASGTIVASDFDSAGELGDALTYSAANPAGTYGLLAIDSATGAWTYTLDNDNATTSALTAAQVVTDTITITVTDSFGATVDQNVVITITGANDAPVITSSATASAPENGTAAAIITTTDAESDNITYSISGTDATLFSIDPTSGVLTFVNAPDFEGETPAHGFPHSNDYSLTVTADDGTVTVDQALTVTVTNVEGGPVFSSAETVAVDENQTEVITLTASDDENDTIAFTISGGDDADSFDLTDGVLTFKAAPNYEVKTSYSLTVTASETTDKDGGTITTPNTTDQNITVSVNDINDAAVITASGDSIAEGTATVSGTATHTDADTNNADNTFTAVADVVATYGTYLVTTAGAWTYTLDSTNATIDALGEGQSTTDTVTITAQDGTTKDITITINGTNDAAVISGTTTGAVTEDAATTTATGTLTHTDVDANNDANVFTAVSTATDSANGYGTYTVTTGGAWTYTLDNTNTTVSALAASATATDSFAVTAEDGTSQTVTVTITGANDAPVITSSATASAPENGTAAAIITTTDAESDNITYSISGTDATLFSIDPTSGVLTFVNAPDFEGETPAHGFPHSNDYSLTVTADDGTVTVDQALTVTVTNVEGGPVFSSAETVAVDENQTEVITLTASDDENDTIAFTISGGDDADSFDLTDGVLTFKAAPNYEVKTSYSLTVTASETTDKDGGTITTPNTTDQNITVSVNDINDAAVITASGDSIAEGTATVSGTATHTDADTNNADNTFTAVADVVATYGTYLVTTAGAWTYTLDSTNATIDALGEGQSTTDTVTITAQDGTTKDITITINGTNDAAVISGTTTGAVTEDAATTTATGTLTHTDVDANNDANVFTAVSTATDSANGYGTYTVTTGGAWTYTLDNTNTTVSALAASATATDSFAVTAEDGTSQTVTVTITGANDAPVTVADTVTISEDALATIISVLDNDTDVDTGDTLSIAAKTNGSNGTVTDNGDGTVSYTPNANFNGTDTFQYRATDGTDQSELTTVTVTVDAVNDDPTGSVTITGDAKTGQTLTAANTLVDADGIGTISYQWAKDGVDVSGATSATLVLSDTDIGSVYTVAASYTDDDGTAETVASSATSAVVDIDKPFMFTSEIIKASAAPDGAYALDPNEDIIKLTLNVDMARTTDATVDSILGGVLDFSLDWSKIEAIQYNDSSSSPYLIKPVTLTDLDSTTTFSVFLEGKGGTANDFNQIVVTSLHLTDPQDTTLMLVDNVDTSGPGKVDHASSNDVAVIYLNPVDSVTSLDVTYGGAVNINQNSDVGITQLSYTTTVDIL